jgi:putative addiction module component (TIGR02574 family)
MTSPDPRLPFRPWPLGGLPVIVPWPTVRALSACHVPPPPDRYAIIISLKLHGTLALSAVRCVRSFHPPEVIALAPTIEQLGLDRLSLEERLAVAEALWESVVREAEAAPLSAAQRAELDRRLSDSIARPGAVTPWEAIKAGALARARQ